MLRLPAKFTRLFEIDLRSLAVFRVAVGVLLLLDLAARLPDLRGHYTDAGVWPRALAIQEEVAERHWYFSLHLLGGSAAFEGALFAIAGAAAAALALGWRTRPATVLSWILLISLHTRMRRIMDGSDMLLRALVFWGMFLPLGVKWSLDARRQSGANPARAVLSAASAAVLLQICLVYWFTAAYKWDPIWTTQGNAIRDILLSESQATPFGSWLTAFPGLLRGLTFTTIWLEILGPLLAFVPCANGFFRTLAVLLFWTFHLAIGTTLNAGLFPLISAGAWLVFLPSWFWEKVLRRAPLAPAVPLRAHWAGNAVAAVFFALILAWNFRGLNPERFGRLWPGKLEHGFYALNLDQGWWMYSGRRTYEIWQWAPAGLRDGSEVNLLTGLPASQPPRPELLSREFHTFRWSLYPGHATQPRPARMAAYADYLKREWNAAHPPEQEVVSLRIYSMHELVMEKPLRPPASQILLYDDANAPPELRASPPPGLPAGK